MQTNSDPFHGTLFRDRSPGSFWAVFGLAILVRVVWVALSDFNGLYGQDGYAYLNAAERLAAGFSFSVQIVGMPNPWTIAAAPGYPLTVSLLLHLFPDISAVFLAQFVNIVSGSAMAALTTAIARRWFTDRVGVGAGVVVAMSPVAVQTSAVIMTDALAASLALGSVWATLRTLQRPTFGWAAGSGLLFGAAVCTRLPVALFAVPIVAILVAQRSFPAKYVLIAIVGALAALIPEYIYLGQQSDGLFSSHMISRWSPLNFWRKQFITPDGQLDYDLPLGIYYLSMISGHKFVSPAIILLSLVGTWTLRKQFALAAVFLCWIGIFVAFCTGLTVINPRYVLPIVPPVAILAVVGLAELHSRWNQRIGHRHSPIFLASVAVMITMVWGQYRALAPFVELSKIERQLAAVVARHSAENDEIVGFKTAFALEWYLGRPVTELFFFDPEAHKQGGKRKIVVWDPDDLAKRATTPVLRQKKLWFDEHCSIEAFATVETIVIGYADCVSLTH